jgi:pimeloyl-ACP methyl ester carboxylesterase
LGQTSRNSKDSLCRLPRLLCSSTVSGCTPPAGRRGSTCSPTTGTRRSRRGGQGSRTPSPRRASIRSWWHFTQIAAGLPAKPVLIGHSFGGLLVEKLLGEDVGVAGVAIDPAQIKGVLPLPLSQLRSGLPALGNPANLHKAVSLTKSEFRYGFGNALTEDESDSLWEKWNIPSPAKPLFQAAAANFALHSEAKVNTDNPTRGPLLLISGLEDHTVPDVVTRSTLKQYRHSTAVTELRQFEGRGHSLTIDKGSMEVAHAVLDWLKTNGH